MKKTILFILSCISISFAQVSNQSYGAEVVSQIQNYTNPSVQNKSFCLVGGTNAYTDPNSFKVFYFDRFSTTPGNGLSIIQQSIYTSTDPGRWFKIWEAPTITGVNGISITQTGQSFVVGKTKRQETYSGTTDGSGNYTVTFSQSYSVAPNIQANIINGTDTQNIRITSVSTTGFTVLVRNRTDALGLLPSWSNVSGASVDILITEK